MAELFGKDFTREGILSRVGDVRQIAGARLAEVADGPSRGARALDVWTGSGLTFTLLADRCLDAAGRAEERRRGTLRFTEPREARELEVRVEVLDSHDAIEEFAGSLP